MATVDVLGESVTRREQTEATRDEYLRVLDAIVAGRLQANVSIKPTAVGLSIDPQLVRENCRGHLPRRPPSRGPSSGSTWRTLRTPRRPSSSSST